MQLHTRTAKRRQRIHLSGRESKFTRRPGVEYGGENAF